MSSETITRNDLTNILNEIVAIDGTDMTAQEISDFVDSLNVTGIHAVDYVVEQGASGGWTYRKWNSGKLEQWYVGNPGSYTVGTQRGNMYTGGYIEYTFPIAFVNTVPTVTVNATLATDNYVILAQAKDHNLSSIKVRIVSGSSVSANQYYAIHIYADGTWK